MNVIAHHRVGGGQNLKHHGNTEGIRGHKGEKAKSAENLPKLFNNKKLLDILKVGVTAISKRYE